jgi:carbonic anhydrase
MEAHLVLADADGKLAVVAVLLDKGNDNPLINELWNNLPKAKGQEVVLENVQIDVSKLLPVNRDYYTFSGSLTTPPCSEDVTWFVLKQPVTISDGEVEQFAKLYRNDARPTQALNSRVVLESK